MELEQIISAFNLIAILILVLPGFIQTNIKKEVFLNNLAIWGVIVILLMILLIFIF